MKRRLLLAVLPALLAGSAALAPLPATAQVQAAPLTAQDKADLQQVETYLNGLKSLKARFLQIAPDGQESQGTAWLERPGRMRFQYDPPTPYLLVAGSGLLVFYDSQLQQTTNIPLGSTPLGILLADHISLSGDVTVTNVTRLPGQLQVTMVRTASPGDGSLTLIFSTNPLQLHGWAVLDAQRHLTRVSLFDVQRGGNFDSSLFHFIDPRFFQQNGGSGG